MTDFLSLADTVEKPECRNCAGCGWVCESHRDRAWGGLSLAEGSCHCGGAGAPCQVCQPAMACATYSEPYRELALRAIEVVEHAEHDTCWGESDFGPTPSESLRAAYDALSQTQVSG